MLAQYTSFHLRSLHAGGVPEIRCLRGLLKRSMSDQQAACNSCDRPLPVNSVKTAGDNSAAPAAGAPHISVCICTYKRPDLILRSLESLAVQETNGLFTFSVVVVDNDRLQSAQSVVSEFAAASSVPVTYCVEPRQNIALARNKAIANSSADLIAFLDDDEFPTKQWLLTLFTALNHYGVDGVLGPVKPHFDQQPPSWVVEAKFYDRPSYPTGLVIDWKKGRTGNVLFKKQLLASEADLFRPQFRTGEDQDFFRRLIEKGHVFVWCHEALAYEVVPPTRWDLAFLLKRALLRGSTSRLQATFGVRDIAASLVAVPAYTAALPFAFFLGRGKFMLLLVKIFDHAGRLLALMGVNPVQEPYVTS
jgi:cellulose synthase/poly-beta-1,6-N-acetylglucosamine synthase-like glycosyltransferase